MNTFSESFLEIYGFVGLAILDILNNMPMESIKEILVYYESEWKYLDRPPVRFSVVSLSRDYSRITEAAEFLNNSGQHYIP